MNASSKKGLSSLGAVALGIAMTGAQALAVGVTVNGQAVVLNPPPIERAGRVFVPLRGVFQQLGASVVYQGGVINATGNGNTISLKIGSTAATVNGSPRPLDVAPFIVGASTYVPLRFVSQALGAGVNYDGTNRLVALTTSAGSSGQSNAAPAPPVPAATVALATQVLRNVQPAINSTVESTRPTVEASYSQPVDANSVRLTLDGLDISTAATRSTTGFIYAPPSPLQSIRHTVTAMGKLASGQSFSQSYAFTSGTAAPKNSLTLVSPTDGEALSAAGFTVSGHTLPNARVHIVAGATANLGGFFAFGTGSYVGDTIADGSGNFSQTVSLQTVGGSVVGLTVTSTDPATKESAEKKLSLRAK